jgi:hypothetical protein
VKCALIVQAIHKLEVVLAERGPMTSGAGSGRKMSRVVKKQQAKEQIRLEQELISERRKFTELRVAHTNEIDTLQAALLEEQNSKTKLLQELEQRVR